MVLIFLIVFGVVVGMIASHKGRSFFPWFLYGALVFPIGLTHALLLKPLERPRPTSKQQAQFLWDALGLKPAERPAELEAALNWEQRSVVKIMDFFRQGATAADASAGVKSPRPRSQPAFGVKCSQCGLMQMPRPTCKGCGAALAGH